MFQGPFGDHLKCRMVTDWLSKGRGATLKMQVQRVQESMKKGSDLKVFFGMRWAFGGAWEHVVGPAGLFGGPLGVF